MFDKCSTNSYTNANTLRQAKQTYLESQNNKIRSINNAITNVQSTTPPTMGGSDDCSIPFNNGGPGGILYCKANNGYWRQIQLDNVCDGKVPYTLEKQTSGQFLCPSRFKGYRNNSYVGPVNPTDYTCANPPIYAKDANGQWYCQPVTKGVSQWLPLSSVPQKQQLYNTCSDTSCPCVYEDWQDTDEHP